MARTNNLTNFLTDVAGAIKEKKGSQTAIPAANFDTEIRNLPGSGNYQQKIVSVGQNGSQTVRPDSGYDAIDELTINTAVPEKQLQTKTYNFTQNGSNIPLTPDTGYDGFSQVNLNIQVPGGVQPLTITYPGHDAFNPTSSVTNDPSADYGFELVNGYYQNMNQEEDDTRSGCIVTINTPYEFDLIIKCNQSSEQDFDYGVISQVDSRAQGVSLQGLVGNRDVEVTIPQGEHTLYIWYQKDGSDFGGTDTFKFQLDFSNCSAVPDETYTINVMHFATQADMLADTQCPVDTFAIVYGYGKNLQSEVYRKTSSGWVFTGVNNDPNLISRNILRGVKIGEVYGAYANGYVLDEDGNIVMPNINNSDVLNITVNGHINSFRIISGVIDPLDRMHVTIQYETYDAIPLTCTVGFVGNQRSANVNVPDSDGVTSTIEVIIPNTNYQQFTYLTLNATSVLALNATYTKVGDLTINYLDNIIFLPTGCSASAELFYNDTFDVYKIRATVNNNVDPQITPDSTKSLGFFFIVTGQANTDANTNRIWVNYGESNFVETTAFSSATQPTSITVTVVRLIRNASDNYSDSTEISGITYEYSAFANLNVSIDCFTGNDNMNVNVFDQSMDIPEDEDFILSVETTTEIGEETSVSTIDLTPSSPSNNMISSISMQDAGITVTTFYTTNISFSITDLTLTKIVPEAVLDETTWPVYNIHNITKASISNLYVYGESVTGYDVSGTISYSSGSYRLSIYKDSTKASLLASTTTSDTTINMHISPFDITGYDFQNLYVVIERDGMLEDSEYYDSTNPYITLNQDGTATFDKTVTDSSKGITLRMTCDIPTSAFNVTGNFVECHYRWYLTIDNPTTFFTNFLSQKGYDAYQAGTLPSQTEIEIIMREPRWNSSSVDFVLLDDNDMPMTWCPIMERIPITASAGSMYDTNQYWGSEEQLKILSARSFDLYPMARRDSLTPITGSDLSYYTGQDPTDIVNVFYDDGLVYWDLKNNDPDVYSFTDNNDGSYTSQSMIATYCYGADPSVARRWDSNYIEFQNKYLPSGWYYMEDLGVSAIRYERFPNGNRWDLHDIIMYDPYVDAYLPGTDAMAPSGRSTILQFDYEGSTVTYDVYIKIPSNPYYSNQDVYYVMDHNLNISIRVTQADNPVEIPKSL